MKTSEIIDKIAKKGKLKDKNIGTLTKWIIENQGKETISEYLSAINEDEVLKLTPKGKQRGKIFLTKLKYWDFFNGLAIKYSEKGWFKESEQIFKAILTRTPNDIDSILNYGAIMIHMTVALHSQGKGINKKQLENARILIFKAFRYDKKVHTDWRTKPAYKNLCYLRVIEAIHHYNQNELFTAFVLGWMSIEMTLYRIWFQFITTKTTTRIDELMKWNSDDIIETLFLGEVEEGYKAMKNSLDTLKGVRNKLLHGEIDKPTLGQVKLCINTALKLIPVLQSSQ